MKLINLCFDSQQVILKSISLSGKFISANYNKYKSGDVQNLKERNLIFFLKLIFIDDQFYSNKLYCWSCYADMQLCKSFNHLQFIFAVQEIWKQGWMKNSTYTNQLSLLDTAAGWVVCTQSDLLLELRFSLVLQASVSTFMIIHIST